MHTESVFPSPQNEPQNAGFLPSDFQQLRTILPQLPTAETQQLQQWATQINGWNCFQQCSQLLMAVVDPARMTIIQANQRFCQLLGIAAPPAEQPETDWSLATLLDRRFAKPDRAAMHHLYRRHVLRHILQERWATPIRCRLLEAPTIVTLSNGDGTIPRYIEFWLRSDSLKTQRLYPELDEFADLGLQDGDATRLQAQLNDPIQFAQLERHLQLDNYRVEGHLLLEGLDVTVRETMQRMTQLLMEPTSVLRSQKFQQLTPHLRSLFRADTSLLLSLERDQIRLLTGWEPAASNGQPPQLESLQNSHFLEAMQHNRVTIVADLRLSCRHPYEQQLVEQGVRSLLLIPLVTQLHHSEGMPRPDNHQLPDYQASGLVVLVSHQPAHFDGVDSHYAEQLIAAFRTALTTAQRQLVQQRFITTIHPAVEWRFQQEAERRNLGLPAEAIVFNAVYPLYGISDIRGSSDERNRAIQTDLLQQMRLALNVIEAVSYQQDSALIDQLRLDLVERMEQVRTKITVDAEVTEIQYLRDQVEIYFDYFAAQGDDAAATVTVYRQACANEHQCVYDERADYDQTIHHINNLLRETWDRWQVRMQQITRHYCDIEATDGIDHMIYAGRSIDPDFGMFQLRSLRYEQLRAVCDCARTALRLQTEYNTQMQVTHLVLVQDYTVDIFHDEKTEKLFDVRGTRDTRYEIVKKRIDKALEQGNHQRITQPGRLTLVYSTHQEWDEYQQYLRYLMREGWIEETVEQGMVEPLQGVTGLKFARVRVCPSPETVSEAQFSPTCNQ